MSNCRLSRKPSIFLAFALMFSLSLALGAFIALAQPAVAAPLAEPAGQEQAYAGSQACANCHKDLHANWHNHTPRPGLFIAHLPTRLDRSQQANRLPAVSHHRLQCPKRRLLRRRRDLRILPWPIPDRITRPTQMPIKPDADLCSTCHKNTTDEWRASPHSAANVQCQSCHNPHAQTPMANSITELCTNCHKERGDSFTHSTHCERRSGVQQLPYVHRAA